MDNYVLDYVGSIPNLSVDYSHLHDIHIGSGAHPSIDPEGTGSSFSYLKRPEREANHSPERSSGVKDAWRSVYTAYTLSCCSTNCYLIVFNSLCVRPNFGSHTREVILGKLSPFCYILRVGDLIWVSTVRSRYHVRYITAIILQLKNEQSRKTGNSIAVLNNKFLHDLKIF